MIQNEQRPSFVQTGLVLFTLVLFLPAVAIFLFRDVSFLAGAMLPIAFFASVSLWFVIEAGGQLFTLLGRLLKGKPIGDLLSKQGGKFTAVLLILPTLICALFGLLAALFSNSYTVGSGVGLFTVVGLGYGVLLRWAARQGVLTELE